MSAPAILAEDLVKTFGSDVRALDGVSLRVEPGTVLGLLGPNGAGKTTVVNVLTTLLRPDSGRAEVAGIDVLRDPAADMSLRVNCRSDLVHAAPVKLAEGVQVVVCAKPQFDPRRGAFSLRLSAIRAVGLGELLARIEKPLTLVGGFSI